MKILLGTLKDKGDDLAAFLEPRIGVKAEVSGGELDIEDKSLKKGIRSRHVKTYVKRFLSMEKVRDDYRVLVEGGELQARGARGLGGGRGGEGREEEARRRRRSPPRRSPRPLQKTKEAAPATPAKAATP